jgi:hypothetical protein
MNERIQNPHSGPRKFWGAMRRIWRDYQWFLVGTLWIVAISLGCIGFQRYGKLNDVTLTIADLIYFTLQLVALESGAIVGNLPWQLEIARFLLPGLAAYTALQALMHVFREQLQVIRLRFLRNHVLICGLSRKGLLLAGGFLKRGDAVVLIEQNGGHELLKSARGLGAIVLIGDATSQMILTRAGIHRARYLISVCAEDGDNAEVAVQAQRLLPGRAHRPVTGIVHIVDPQLCALLNEKEIGSTEVDGLRLELFNIYDRGAQWLLQHYPVSDSDGTPSKSSPHILVVGLDLLGESIVLRAARQAYDRKSKRRPALRITVVDHNAEEKFAALQARAPRIAQACKVSLVAAAVDGSSSHIAALLGDSLEDNSLSSIFISTNDEGINLKIGLTLRQHLRGREIPIVIRMREDNGLATLINREKGNLHAFTLLDHTCTPDLLLGGTHEFLSRALHEEYIRHQSALGYTSDDNPALVPWTHLPDALKESNRQQVDQIGLKLNAIGHGIQLQTDWDAPQIQFTTEQVEIMACMEHERWFEALTKQGWRHAPSPKDAGRKTHPALLPWQELPEEEREKNRRSVREIPAFLARSGFSVCQVASGN